MLLSKLGNIVERIVEEAEDEGMEELFDDDMEELDDIYFRESSGVIRRYAKGVVDCEPLVKEEKRPVFSARLGPVIQRSQSVESLATDISLLSCSSIAATTHVTWKVQKKSPTKAAESAADDVGDGYKRPETLESQESGSTTNWEKMAKRKGGGLDSLLMKDRDAAQAVGGLKAMNRLFQAKTTLEAMTEVERRHLLKCADTTGLFMNGGVKSLSMSDLNQIPPTNAQKSRTRSAKGKRALHKRRRIKCDKSMFREYDRVHEHITHNKTVTHLPYLSQPSSATSTETSGASFNRHIGKNLRHRIFTTMDALGRMSGLGDNPDTPINNYEQRVRQNDTYVHIDQDFEKMARIPYRVKVAPQLARTIRQEIRERIGKPKPKEIKSKDLQTWTLSAKKDARSHRNLMVYTWLQNLDEKQFVTDVHGLEKHEVVI